MKFLYNSGKSALTAIEKQVISQMLHFSDQRPLLRHLEKLEDLGWIRKNQKTGMTLIISFDKINYTGNGVSRASVKCGLSEIANIYGFVGAAIYSYLHKNFCRRVKRERSVCLKGRTYHSLSPTFNYRNEYAPVALTGVKKVFNLSIKKSSSLKHAAAKCGYIKIKKPFDGVKLSKTEMLLKIKYGELDETEHFRLINGKYQVQQIDHVLPMIELCRRKSAKS